MRHENVPISGRSRVDWKALGYLVSMVSVLLLGAIAWPGPGDPRWHAPVLLAGMATSILGMGFRYRAHLQEKKEMREIEKMEAEAGRS